MRERLLTLLFILMSLMVLHRIETAQAKTPRIPKIDNSEQSSLQPENLHQSLQTLMNATLIDGAHVGYAARPGPNHVAYQKAKSLGAELYPQLIQLQSEATLVGQLYLAALIREINPEQGTVLLKPLISNETSIPQMSGCLITGTTVGKIATQLLDADEPFNF